MFEDLSAQHDVLEAVLAVLDPDAWRNDSGAAGWTVADVVMHLAQPEEFVLASVTGHAAPCWPATATRRHRWMS